MNAKVEVLPPLKNGPPRDMAAQMFPGITSSSGQACLPKLKSVIGGHTRQSVYDRLGGGSPHLPERKGLTGAQEIAQYIRKNVRNTYGRLAAATLPAKKEGGSYVTSTLILDVYFMLEDAYSFNQVKFARNERAKYSGLFLLLGGPSEPTMEQVIWSLQDVGFCLPD